MARLTTLSLPLILTAALLVTGCRSEAPVEPEDAWAAAADRAEAATFLGFKDRLGSSPAERYLPGYGVAFYIGNDEWVSAGDRRSGEYQYALRQGESDFAVVSQLGDDFRPVQVIGYDAATRISLLEAPGDGVRPLRLATAIPPPCTPLRFAGYWVSFLRGSEERLTAWAAAARAELRFPDPAACDPAVPPPLIEEGFFGSDVMVEPEYFAPGTVGAALGEVVIEAGIPLLRLHLPDGMDRSWYEDGWWEGGPLVTAAGDVVGVLPNGSRDYVAAPAVIDALARIRADALAPAPAPPGG